MNWIDPVEVLHGYGIFLRAGAFFFLMPMLASPVPIMVRTAASAFLAVMLVPLTDPAVGLLVPVHVTGLVLLAAREIFIGAIMGYAVQLVFHLCHLAGQMISMEIGLMQSNLFNPLTKQQDTVLSTGMTMLVVVLIFVTNTHHVLLFAFFRSLELMPVGSLITNTGAAETLVRSSGKIFIVGLQMAAPMIAVNYIVTLSFAILGRAVPGMNILVLSFGVRVFVGFTVLALVFALVVQFLIGTINDTPEEMLQFLPFR
jgi:flagellar biosynthesis protein FliR